MYYEVTLTFNLDQLDAETFNLYDEGYHEKITAIENYLYKIDGVEKVMFNHTSWIKVNFGNLELHEIQKEAEVVEKEIKEIFAEYGVKLEEEMVKSFGG